MAYEDWTTYTEVDTGGYLTVIANQITFTNLPKNVDSYVYKDKGAGHFGNYTHDVDSEFTTFDSDGEVVFWGVSNTIDDVRGWSEGQQGELYRASTTYYIYLIDRGNMANDAWNGAAVNTRYYTECKRVGTTSTIKIYSDAAHANLLDTLTMTAQNTTYRYIYGVCSHNVPTPADGTGYVYNLDLNESAIETHTPSDTAKASDSIKFAVEEHIADTAKASDGISFFGGLKFAIGDTAKSSDGLVTKVEEHIIDTAKALDSLIIKAKNSLADNAKSSDGLTTKIETSLSDTAKANDSLNTKAGSALSDIAKASDIISFIKNAKFAIGDVAKASDTINFIKSMKYAISDTAKASDIVSFFTGVLAKLKSAKQSNETKLKSKQSNETKLKSKQSNETR